LNLRPGTYQIRESQPLGYFSVGAIPGLLDGSTPVGQTVVNNRDILTEIVIPLGDQRATKLDFAEAQPTSLSGFVYQDLNENGRRDTNEPGLRDVEIRLEVIDALAAVTSQTVRTGSDGSYRFETLPPGVYRVVEVTQPADFFDGEESIGTVLGAPRGQLNSNDIITEIQLFGNERGVEYNFGELPPSSISGHVCVAMPGFDCFSTDPAGIGPLEGVLLELVDSNGNVVATTRSAADGSYRFDRLPSGVYTIIETTPEDLLDGESRAGSINGRRVGDDSATSEITQIILGVGQNGLNYDFCELRPGSISGHVFEDSNNDGFRQPDEPLIANATVTLYDSQGSEVGQMQTDERGYYRFALLRPGRYRVVETQPDGYLDGLDQVGTIQGRPVGVVDSALDTISEIVLPSGLDGINYDFGEILPASIEGRVIVDSNGNCILDAELDRPLPGITIELLNDRGQVIQTTTTDEDGRYRFSGLIPGQYSVRETQPQDLHQGSAEVGNGGGVVTSPDLLSAIPIRSGDELVEYNFCEIPPAVISGYVFQDGPTLVTADGNLPAQLRPLRDGLRDESDRPIGGVTLELRAIDGQLINSDQALSGTYTGPTIIVTTDGDGYFEFRGLKPGTYHIYQRQPIGFADALDTAGSTGGFPINPEDAIDDLDIQRMLNVLRSNPNTDPRNDAILSVTVLAGDFSIENNFSEVRLGKSTPPPPPPEDPVPPIDPPKPPFVPPPENGFVTLPFSRVLVAPPTLQPPPPIIGLGGQPEYTWHLSVINAGTPRGSLAGRRLTKEQIARAATRLNVSNWSIVDNRASQWAYVSKQKTPFQTIEREAFDVDGAIPLAGDFNGDAIDELALFLDGEWLIDINGNGRWDDADMWAKLGEEDDLPVVGDWDGDGKDDIGIFGPEWEGDDKAIEFEPGLPDPDNRRLAKPKNIPPEAADSPVQDRWLQRSAEGPARADVIDHVFRYGVRDDQPIAGDFNGDGVTSVGLFRDGNWRLDANGDGRWTADADQSFWFGQSGDIAVVGDFDGDGIDEIAVLRGNELFVDSNRNHRLDATDRVFQIQADGRDVVIGDFDGDGKDEAAVMERGRPRTQDSSPVRQAKRLGD
jgi:serine-aspartate repeat-containing protein C/D/E